MTSTFVGKPKPQLAINNRRKRNVFLCMPYTQTGHIAGLYENTMSAVLVQGATGEWFCTSVGVRQGCLLSPNPLQHLSRGYHDTRPRLDKYNGTISIGGRKITNLRFADGNDGITGEEDELTKFVQNLDTAATKFGMEIIFYLIRADTTKLMTKNGTLQRDTTIEGQTLETVEHFKYLGAIICDESSTREVLSRAASNNGITCYNKNNLERQEHQNIIQENTRPDHNNISLCM